MAVFSNTIFRKNVQKVNNYKTDTFDQNAFVPQDIRNRLYTFLSRNCDFIPCNYFCSARAGKSGESSRGLFLCRRR